MDKIYYLTKGEIAELLNDGMEVGHLFELNGKDTIVTHIGDTTLILSDDISRVVTFTEMPTSNNDSWMTFMTDLWNLPS